MEGNYLRNQKPVTHHPEALKTARLAEVNLCEGTRECVCEHTYTLLKTPPALHSLIKSTHRSPITPVQGYLKSQDVYRLFPVLLTLLQGLQWGWKISPMR